MKAMFSYRKYSGLNKKKKKSFFFGRRWIIFEFKTIYMELSCFKWFDGCFFFKYGIKLVLVKFYFVLARPN
jgi:hypothetical protein